MNTTFHIKDIQGVAEEFLRNHADQHCFALYAEMGSGKTTFISAIGKALGVKDSMSSPTFSIINEYHLPAGQKKMYHMDWYRLKNTEDAIQAGVEDVLSEKDAWCFIEWPSIAEELLPKQHVKIFLHFVSETEREIRTEVVL